MTAKNSTTRFSSRIDDYVKYRPHYPVEIIDLLAAKCDMTPESVIADIGSGTGILTRLFLENGNPVIGVEPNKEMREAGEAYLAEYARFNSVEGTSEATRLPPKAADVIIAGQAFHWFDQIKSRAEFQRVLKDDGWVVLVWNDRRVDTHASTLVAHKDRPDKGCGAARPFSTGISCQATKANLARPPDSQGLL